MKLRYHPPSTYFVHIPKTAGVAFGHLLASAYQPREMIHIAPATLAHWNVGQLPPFRHYHSWHQDRGMYELVGRKDVACLTLLRDPVERAASTIYFLHHLLRERPHDLPANLLARFSPLRDSTFDECLNDEIVIAMVGNYQTRLLGQQNDYSSFFGGGNAYDLNQFPDIPLPLLAEKADAKKVFTDACAWLAEMPVVGITERYAETVMLTCDFLGITPPQQVPRANTNPNRINFEMRYYRQRLDPAIVAQIEEMNTYDTELYTYACELFAEQWSCYQVRPKRSYSLAPRLYGVRTQVRRILRPVKQLIKRSVLRIKR